MTIADGIKLALTIIGAVYAYQAWVEYQKRREQIRQDDKRQEQFLLIEIQACHDLDELLMLERRVIQYTKRRQHRNPRYNPIVYNIFYDKKIQFSTGVEQSILPYLTILNKN